VSILRHSPTGRRWIRGRKIIGVLTALAVVAALGVWLLTPSVVGKRRKASDKQPADPRMSSSSGVGSSPRGPTARLNPTRFDVLLEVGQLSQETVSRYPDKTVFALAPGVHRLLAPIQLRSGDELLGFFGAVISGSRDISRADWRPDDAGHWYLTDQPSTPGLSLTSPDGVQICGSNALCKDVQDLYLDKRFLHPAESVATLRPGGVYHDQAAGEFWLAQDPSGHVIETPSFADNYTDGDRGVVQGANVVLQNLTIEEAGTGWEPLVRVHEASVVTNCLIQLSHMSGFYGDGSSKIESSIVRNNGQLGLSGAPAFTSNVEVAFNNQLGFNPGWEAGGGKYAHGDGMVIEDSWFHHNEANGFWFDADDRNILVRRSLFEDNATAGLAVELSAGGTIRQNVFRRNGANITSRGDIGWYVYGVGLHVADSSSILVEDNMSYDNEHGPISVVTLSDRGADDDRFHPRDLVVRNNSFGFINTPHDFIDYAPSPGNRDNSKAGFLCPNTYGTCSSDLAEATWERNDYYVLENGDQQLRWFMWGSSSQSFLTWQESGRDVTGVMRVGRPARTPDMAS